MTKFKQIIGRGTRVKEEYGKLYFTILDFRNVTDLFADPSFDGEPERIKKVEGEAMVDDVFEYDGAEAPIPVAKDENEHEYQKGESNPFPFTPKSTQKADKIYVNGVDVTILNTRQLHFDKEGKPVTLSLKDYSRGLLQESYQSLDQFLQAWSATDKKEAIIHELQEQGVPIDELLAAVDRESDLFDIICHVAFDQKPRTRKERAEHVKKRNYFTKYSEKARKVLESLLDKYADEGISNLESMEVLKVNPLSEYGSPLEIVKSFGGKSKYLEAVKELENEIYSIA